MSKFRCFKTTLLRH